jgi:hypothetical protein
MTADSVVEGEGSNGGGSGEEERRPSVTTRGVFRAAFSRAMARRSAYALAGAANAHTRAYDCALTYAHVRAYVSLAMKGSGLLALLLSTVALYFQSLEKEDFLCILAIALIQAAG